MELKYTAWLENDNGDRNEVTAVFSIVGYYAKADSLEANGVAEVGELNFDDVVAQISALESSGYSRDYEVCGWWDDSVEEEYYQNIFDSFKDSFPFEEPELKQVLRLCYEVEAGAFDPSED